MTTQLIDLTQAAAELQRRLPAQVFLPGQSRYDELRAPWSAAVDQRPAAVAAPPDAEAVVAVVRAATELGLTIAAQSTGHNAAPLHGLETGVLVRTSALQSVEIDLRTRTARVGSGVVWGDVVAAAALHGLAALHGSSPDVGVTGYTLGGGMGWFARRLGLAANAVTAVELVTPDGRLRRTDADTDPDLFWALRGGGGSFGVVTALEFRLFPIETAYAGALVWDWQHAERVICAWAEWTATAPDEVTTSCRILQLPPIDEVPPPLRGRQVVMIDGAVDADDPTSERILAPLRALGPELDMWERVPAAALVRLHGDPEGPTPAVSSTLMLAELPPTAIQEFVRAAGPGSGSTLMVAELRQLGGALARPADGGGALDRLAGRFVAFGVTVCPDEHAELKGRQDAEALVDAVRPWAAGRQYLNFVEEAVDASCGYAPGAWQRLRDVRDAVDPMRVMIANHRVE
jgi:FAD/FMN-containing dehydrogenase